MAYTRILWYDLLLDTGDQLISMKQRVDKLNEETLTHKYTTIDVKEKFESIVHEVKFESTSEGGSKSKIIDTYYTKGDVELKEEDVKVGKDRALGMSKVVETYLFQYPDTTSSNTPMLMLEVSKALLHKFKKS